MSREQQMNADWMRGVAKVLDALNEALRDHDNDFYIGGKELVIMHGDGWSPGVAVLHDDLEEWVFEPKYDEVEK